MSMTLIEHIEVGSGGAASIEFTSIPADYTDLYLLLSLRHSAGSDPSTDIQFNGNTANYSNRELYATGSGVGSSTSYNGTDAVNASAAAISTSTANTFSNQMVYIPNYTSSAAKSVSADGAGENNATLNFLSIAASLWNDTSAITSLLIKPAQAGSGIYVQYSSATLYGITAGSDGTTTVS